MPSIKKNLHNPVTDADLQAALKVITTRFDSRFDKLERKQEQNKKEIITAFKAETEARRVDLFGAHKDELDIVAGEKEASSKWKSVPRRLLIVETDVEKIKDHLEIS